MPDLALAPAPVDPLADCEASHEVCCIDEKLPTGRISMCGVPLEDGDLDEDVPSCLVCQDLLEQWAFNADTYGEDPQPGDAPCRLCPRRNRGGGYA